MQKILFITFFVSKERNLVIIIIVLKFTHYFYFEKINNINYIDSNKLKEYC